MERRLELYSQLLTQPAVIGKKRSLIKEPEQLPPIILPDDAKLITIADLAPETREVVGIYNLSNYRRRQVAVILSPDLRVSIDDLIFDTRGLLECEVTL